MHTESCENIKLALLYYDNYYQEYIIFIDIMYYKCYVLLLLYNRTNTIECFLFYRSKVLLICNKEATSPEFSFDSKGEDEEGSTIYVCK